MYLQYNEGIVREDLKYIFPLFLQTEGQASFPMELEQ